MQMLAALETLNVHVTHLVTTTGVSSQEPITQMISLMHHFSTPENRNAYHNQCSTSCLKCQFTPSAFCQFMIYTNGFFTTIRVRITMDTQDPQTCL